MSVRINSRIRSYNF